MLLCTGKESPCSLMLNDIHAAAPELSGAINDSSNRYAIDFLTIVEVSHHCSAITTTTVPSSCYTAAHKALNAVLPTKDRQVCCGAPSKACR